MSATDARTVASAAWGDGAFAVLAEEFVEGLAEQGLDGPILNDTTAHSCSAVASATTSRVHHALATPQRKGTRRRRLRRPGGRTAPRATHSAACRPRWPRHDGSRACDRRSWEAGLPFVFRYPGFAARAQVHLQSLFEAVHCIGLAGRGSPAFGGHTWRRLDGGSAARSPVRRVRYRALDKDFRCVAQALLG